MVEDVLKGTYNIFAHSSKRKEEFAELQKANDESGKILRSCATRWLGRSDALASVVKSLVSIIDYVAELSAMYGLGRVREAVIKTISSPRVLASAQSSVRFGEPNDLPRGPTTDLTTYAGARASRWRR